jgi:hypothetical protein
VVIDEVPCIVASETITSSASWPWFKANFSLTPAKLSGFSTISLKSGLKRSAIARDTHLAPLLNFYDRVVSETNEVFAQVTDWAALGLKDVAWNYFSTWDVAQLADYRSVTLLGNDFKNSVFAKTVAAKNPNVFWHEIATPLRQPFARRSMEIRFFAYRHSASTSLFTTDDGQRHLRLVGDHLRATCRPAEHIWATSGSASAVGSIFGTKLSPHQSGSNFWQSKTEASFIYTAKPKPFERTMADVMGFDGDAFWHERELEPMVQFMARTSVRDPNSTESIFLTVYDHVQAQHLKRYFDALGYVDCELKMVDLGFAHYVKPRAERIIAEKTPEEARELADRVREQTRLRVAKLRANKKARLSNAVMSA